MSCWTPIKKKKEARRDPAPLKRALIIGVTYAEGPDPSERLMGAKNDADEWAARLLQQYGYPPQNVRVMSDVDNTWEPVKDSPQRDGPHQGVHLKPTRRNILEQLEWLTADVRPGDQLTLIYSGHGVQVPDWRGDEDDCWDEAICPCDCDSYRLHFVPEKVVLDDEIHEAFVKLPKGAVVWAFFDCCHSGTIMDLDFNVHARCQGKPLIPKGEAKSRGHELHEDLPMGAMAAGVTARRAPWKSEEPGLFYKAFIPVVKALRRRRALDIKAQIYCISGCFDAQTSVEATRDWYGAAPRPNTGPYSQNGGLLCHCIDIALQQHGPTPIVDQMFRTAEQQIDRIRQLFVARGCTICNQYFQLSFTHQSRPNLVKFQDAASAQAAQGRVDPVVHDYIVKNATMQLSDEARGGLTVDQVLAGHKIPKHAHRGHIRKIFGGAKDQILGEESDEEHDWLGGEPVLAQPQQMQLQAQPLQQVPMMMQQPVYAQPAMAGVPMVPLSPAAGGVTPRRLVAGGPVPRIY
mmetsp:Transcript_39183/g.94155  ORF Transcript_39183/g.94155 Transcript_39183/m.94155 type:complete len:518 (+) Transcript_39183:49-1602(+)